jgi:hypothetical protein
LRNAADNMKLDIIEEMLTGHMKLDIIEEILL